LGLPARVARGTFGAMLDATERKALTLASFAAACIAFMPAEILSGLALLTLSAALFEYDRVTTRREEAAAAAAPPLPDGTKPGA